ncbi:MAG TPA: M28 family metallopeptidase [Anaerolineales bacterium]|nr:M28 family metallopeptidase [Anaerolineales bacterium]
MISNTFRVLIIVTMLAATFAYAPAALADSPSCDRRVNNTLKKLLECVTLEGAREHQAALQAIADANGGIRTSGTPGFDKSIAYAKWVFTKAGYKVTIQPFEFQTFISLSAPILEQVSPPPAGPIENNIMSYSGSGDVTATVSLPGGDFRGCEAADFAGFPAGNIALISRGAPAGFPVACTFGLKATNAYNAGASGVVIYNNAPGVINGTLGNAFTLDIPVTSVTQEVGQRLSTTPDLVLRLKTETFRGIATTYNILAESKKGDPNNVVMVGAHLDSVNAGPGIQDNGSGSAAILEVAEQMAKVKPHNKVRFALWGAEEANLVGSTYYVNNLSPEELERIALYLNFDMIGSPNHVFFIYDGDDSDAVGAGPGPEGSAAIEKTFETYYTLKGLPFKGTDFSGRSDYGPFIAAGIPSGGLFTGAEGIKTPDEVALWGGTAGQQYDPCYHLACDTYDNINLSAYDVNVDAVAFATLKYALSTKDVNGVKGKGNFPPVSGTASVPDNASDSSLHGHEALTE